MELPELSVSLLESLVGVVTTLGKVVVAVAGSDGDVLLKGSSEGLWRHLDPFINHLDGNLRLSTDIASGKALAKLTTPRPTWDSVESVVSAWQTLVTKVVCEWRKLVSEATELFKACRDAANTLGGSAAAAAERARDLQKKVEEWLNSVDDLVTETRQLPVAADKEKAAAALKKYKAEVGEAKEKTLEALKAMEDATVFLSKLEAAIKRGRRAEVAVEPLGGLVTACAAATVMFQDLRRWVGDIEAKLKGAKEESPDVPEDLVSEVVQIHKLGKTNKNLYTQHLNVIVVQLQEFLPRDLNGSQSEEVADKCEEAKKAIQELLEGQ